ncbi:M48 family metallopeptidase [Achromobacter sp. F4_2707]|uniref:M48 family metallopeptidase n=1 Tax=Achromobacter sp. F4_2707 TaxID=3114286 RepID=UPI0039C621DA
MKKALGMSRRIVLWGAALTLSALTGCASVQTTQSGVIGVDRKQFMATSVPAAQLQQAANQQYSQMMSEARAKGALDTNAAQVRRVQTITNRLVAHVGAFRPDAGSWPWEIHVISSDEVNAWCMPGGKMAIYTGLINRIKPTDDELAAVLGHEMAHALREHSREQISQQMATQVGLSVLSAVTGVSAVGDLGSALTNVMFTLPNSRTHESEADLIGVELAARAGYDPRAAVTLWQKMAALGGGSAPPEFLSTHPSASTRSAELQRNAQKVMPLYEAAKR